MALSFDKHLNQNTEVDVPVVLISLVVLTTFMILIEPSVDLEVCLEVLRRGLNSFSEMMITAEAWIQLLDPYNMPDMSITVNPVLALVRTIYITCITKKYDDFSMF